MGLFSRKPKAHGDPALTELTVEEADELRRLVVTTLAEFGITARVEGGDVHTEGGASFGLWNLATECRAQDPRRWPLTVDQRMRELVTPTAAGLDSGDEDDDLSPDELLAHVRWRLAEAAYVRGLPVAPAEVVEFAPGVVAHLVVDTDPVRTIDADLAAMVDRDALRESADRNTRDLLREDLATEVRGEPPATLRVVAGESLLTATLVLHLDDVVHRFDPGADLTHGVLFAVPTRHQIGYHVLESSEAPADVLRGLRGFARWGYEEGAGPISPDVFRRAADGTVGLVGT